MPTGSDSLFTRRHFIKATGHGLLTATMAGTLIEAAGAANRPATIASPPKPNNATGQKPISLPPFEAETERQSSPPATPLPPDQRVGFAIVGLGNLSLQQILPAFAESKLAKPVALVSGEADKAREVARQHGIAESSIYNYQTYDRLRDNPDVQAIYIVLPNSMHAEFTVRGAQAGKHILCEKPMATSPQECETMIAACRQANRHLMVAYRIQYEPHNTVIQKMVRDKQYGAVKVIEAVNTQNQGNPNQWRQKRALAGGGSLPDIGLYCLNTARWLTGEEPIEVLAQSYSTPGDPRFREVEETVLWQMRFPSGILSTNSASYGAHDDKRYRVHAVEGWYGLDPAFSYNGLQMQLSYARDKVEYRQTPQIEEKNQFALEIDHMAECILQNKTPYSPGEEGLQDHRIMAAIYKSAQNERPVKLPKYDKLDVFRGTSPSS